MAHPTTLWFALLLELWPGHKENEFNLALSLTPRKLQET